MSIEKRNRLIDEGYADLLIRYNQNFNLIKEYGFEEYVLINTEYALVHVPIDDFKKGAMNKYGWNTIQTCYGLLDTLSLEVSGITKVQGLPNLALKGQGILIGFIDTGIDYTNPLFKNADNTTRIVSIWDQTIEDNEQPTATVPFGMEYVKENINQALANPRPFNIVPSTDANGHGTMLAGVATGALKDNNKFSGVVPASEIVVVKLKSAKEYLKEFFLIPKDSICYQESDIMFGINYLIRVAHELNRPIAICIALGTSSGAHDGSDPLSNYLSFVGDAPGTAIVIAAGNEGNTLSHYYGEIDSTTGNDTIELKVGKAASGFTMELWGNIPNIYSIELISPTGEYIYRIPARINEKRVINFLFEKTTIYVNYVLYDLQSGKQLILLRFLNPSEGVWKIRVYAKGNKYIHYHVWLPIRSFLGADTFFINSNPDTTITSPGNATIPITVTAYNHQTGNLYLAASRGFTGLDLVKPDFAAPGVDVYTPGLNNNFQLSSGTSIAAAHTTGVAAMLLEWGIVNNNLPTISSVEIKNFLIRGAKRNPVLSYPNKEWGYGALDVYSAYINLRSD